jgi:hypothetical protein
MTGVLASYPVTPDLAASFGICNVWSSGVNAKSFPAQPASDKTYMGSLTYTCPTNCGAWSGSTLSVGIIHGWDAVNAVHKTSWYAGGTVNTPISGVKAGLAFDYVTLGENAIGGGTQQSGYQYAFGAYLNWQAAAKLSLNTRAEYFQQSDYLVGTGAGDNVPAKAYELTETIQYDLWNNVLARAEFRWDHAADGSAPFSDGRADAYLLAVNFVYKF